MHELVTSASGWLLHYLIRSAIVLTATGVAAWLGERWLRRIGAKAQHRLWVAALLAGVILPLTPAGLLSGLAASGGTSATGVSNVTYRVIDAASTRWTLSSDVCTALAALYMLTVLFALVRLGWRWRSTCALARRANVPATDARAERLLEDAVRRFGIRAPEVRCSAEMRGPVVLGWQWPLLLVPDGFFDAPEDDAAAALAHECAHIARRDFARNLFYEFAASAVTYHPACRLIRRRITATRELLCDELAASTRGDRPEYAASLLRLAQAMAAPAVRVTHAIGVFDGNTLEERIMRLTMDVPRVSRGQRLAMVAVSVCALLGGAATATALSLDVTPKVAAATHEKVYKVGGDVSAPVLTHSVDAEFSKKAKDAKYQGVAVVSLVVDSNGEPQHVRIERKLGMGLDEEALEAVRQYRFKPAMLHGKPVAVAIKIEVNFRLY